MEKPRCFKSSNAALKLEQVSYFADSKSWMQINIMENVLGKLNKMKVEKRNVLLFLDNAPVHPEGLQGKYSNIKVVFLPKNTTSRLQPLDAGIIKNFKVKYRKKLLRHVISRITNDLSASDIAEEVDILQAITWVTAAWNEVTEKTIRNCFAKCGILEQTAENDDAELDGEFAELFKELTEMDEIENDLTADGYIDFEINVPSCHPPINSEMVDWKATSIQECFDEYVNKEYVELDSEDDQEPDSVEDEQELFQMSPREALAMIDRLMYTNGLNNDDQKALFQVKENIEKIVICQKKAKRHTRLFLNKNSLCLMYIICY